ncbi:type II toxin-antitoxin system VapC family toxin [Nocardioides rubriscoriae]|uniref:type II toxin-antitoxin system VapC family toxin n=1 Tax=Nocardioides rubriscoriae TaxID=642762 RepID=UPI001B85E7C8|nr:type II toxin-antitoxin system VapC family toxin [Nocardioides rubriscoriae]
MDANVLLYAVNSTSAQHEEARAWLDRSLSGADSVAMAWVPLLAFVRISTRPGIFPRPLTTGQASEIVQDWLAQPACRVLAPTARHPYVVADLLAQVGVGGNLVNDAHLAALAIEHRAEIVSYDADFARFPGVRWSRPTLA